MIGLNNRLHHDVSTNLVSYKQLDGGIDKKLMSDNSISPAKDPVNDLLHIFTVRLRGGKNYGRTFNLGLTCLWECGSTNSMINLNNIHPYKSKYKGNNVKYSTSSVTYSNINHVKVPFIMPYFNISKIITHWFHINNAGGHAEISYDMIIVCELMVQLFLKANFGLQILKWDETIIPKKNLGKFLGKTNLTQHEMQEVVMQTAETYSTREDTERIVKILVGTYSKSDLDEVALDAFQLDANQR